MKLLNDVLKQPKQIILSIPREGELSWMNDDSSSDWTNHYLATITVQYVLGDAYIAFDSECLVSVADDNKVYMAEAPKGTLKNSVGAGDSMVAGFLAGYLKTGSYEEALKLGTAAGSATAFTSWLADADQIRETYKGLA